MDAARRLSGAGTLVSHRRPTAWLSRTLGTTRKTCAAANVANVNCGPRRADLSRPWCTRLLHRRPRTSHETQRLPRRIARVRQLPGVAAEQCAKVPLTRHQLGPGVEARGHSRGFFRALAIARLRVEAALQRKPPRV